MKRYLSLLTIIVVAFVMMVGINVNAEDDYYLYPDGAYINIGIPIHKTDSNKKALEGAIFTLKDFNNTISYSSSDEKDGDYLIEVNKSGSIKMATKREGLDQEFRIVDYTDENSTLTEILDVLPTKYSDIFRKAQTPDDLMDMLDLPLYIFSQGDQYYSVGFYIPLKVEESKVPAGYKAKNIVVPAFVFLGFDDGDIYASLIYMPGFVYFEGPLPAVPAYFEYKDGTDYEAIFDKINIKLSKMNIYNENNLYEDLLELFEDNGAVVNDSCEMPMPTGTPRILSNEDLEKRFDDEIEDYFCPINLVDEKEDIIVNPSTAGTIGVIVALLAVGSVVVLGKNVLKNN